MFVKIKWKPVVQLETQKWVQLVFAVDITDHLNNLNEILQGCNKVVTQYYDHIGDLKSKLALWEMPLSKYNPSHFPCLKDLCRRC